MKPPGLISRAAGRQRGIFIALIVALISSTASAKIIQNQAAITPESEAPLTLPPNAAGPSVNYYLFGTTPSWWNQNSALPPRWPNLIPALGTLTITRRVLRDAISLRLARQAEHEAVSKNKPRSWNHDNFHGTVLLLRSFHNEAGLLCRDFSHTVTIGAADNRFDGTACLQADGTWLLVG